MKNKLLILLLFAFIGLSTKAQIWSPVGTGADTSIQSSIFYNGNLYIGGKFMTIGGVSASEVAMWDGTNYSALGSGVNGGLLGGVYSFAVYNGELYVGGQFTLAGGVAVNNIAKWNGTTWSDVGGGVNSYVQALCVYNGELVAGGGFTNRIAKWNGTSWSQLGTGMNNDVRTLTVFNSMLYAGGFFTTANGVPANYIANWDGSTWSALGVGVNNGIGGGVLSLAVYNNELYVAGGYTTAGGMPAKNITKWNSTSWSLVGNGVNASAYSLIVLNNELYISGSFDSTGNISASRTAKWNGSSWSNLGIGTNDEVYTLAIDTLHNTLYAGGRFTLAGGNSALHIAKWVNCYTPAIVASGNITFCQGDSVRLNAHTRGGNNYQWSNNGNPITNATNSIYTVTQNGSYTASVNFESCGSITSSPVIVTVNPTYNNNISTSICQGDTYTFPDGVTSTTGTTHTSHLSTFSSSCDSIIVTTLSINQLPTVTLDFVSAGISHLCGNTYPYSILSGGSPAGGIYSGLGVSNDTIYCYGMPYGRDTIRYIYTDIHTCSNTASDTVIIDICEGINELNTSIFSISPNPFSVQTIISFNTEQKNTIIKIMDMLGKEIRTMDFTGKQCVIEKGELNDGIYFVQITDEKKNRTNKKIIVR